MDPQQIWTERVSAARCSCVSVAPRLLAWALSCTHSLCKLQDSRSLIYLFTSGPRSCTLLGPENRPTHAVHHPNCREDAWCHCLNWEPCTPARSFTAESYLDLLGVHGYHCELLWPETKGKEDSKRESNMLLTRPCNTQSRELMWVKWQR